MESSIKLSQDPRSTSLFDFFNEAGPYYTSYPTLGLWSDSFQSDAYGNALLDFFKGPQGNEPIHLYVHIPFCAKLCWYCMCNIKVSNNRDEIKEFVNYLTDEVSMLRRFFDEHDIVPNIKEIHLGGGTPSHLSHDEITLLINAIGMIVNIKELDEFAMEIDPRTVTREDMHFYADSGVNRISFGVQDFNPSVQQAIHRIQPPEMVSELLSPEVRSRFKGVNFDLLYALPRQTLETFRETVRITKELSPERITLLKYAHIPEVRKHMKLIDADEIPPLEHFPLLFTETADALREGGYCWVGVDNFAKNTDTLAKAVYNDSVHRTFNGFTPGRTRHLFGLGPTTTGAFGRYYSQNVYELKEYYAAIKENKFPTYRGYAMNQDDLIRRRIIFELLCRQKINFAAMSDLFSIHWNDYFKDEMQILSNGFVDRGIISLSKEGFSVNEYGRIVLRQVCKVFDTYHKGKDYQIKGC